MTIIEEERRFVAYDDNHKIMGEITYSPAGDNLWIIDHTQVNEQYRGKNVGQQILNFVVAKARNNKIMILPLCPFAKHVLLKNKDAYRDVLYGIQ